MVDTASAYKRIVAEMEEAELQEEKKVRVAAQKQSATRIRKTVGTVKRSRICKDVVAQGPGITGR